MSANPEAQAVQDKPTGPTEVSQPPVGNQDRVDIGAGRCMAYPNPNECLRADVAPPPTPANQATQNMQTAQYSQAEAPHAGPPAPESKQASGANFSDHRPEITPAAVQTPTDNRASDLHAHEIAQQGVKGADASPKEVQIAQITPNTSTAEYAHDLASQKTQAAEVPTPAAQTAQTATDAAAISQQTRDLGQQEVKAADVVPTKEVQTAQAAVDTSAVNQHTRDLEQQAIKPAEVSTQAEQAAKVAVDTTTVNQQTRDLGQQEVKAADVVPTKEVQTANATVDTSAVNQHTRDFEQQAVKPVDATTRDVQLTQAATDKATIDQRRELEQQGMKPADTSTLATQTMQVAADTSTVTQHARELEQQKPADVQKATDLHTDSRGIELDKHTKVQPNADGTINVKPGDILAGHRVGPIRPGVGANGHLMIYLGTINGRGVIADYYDGGPNHEGKGGPSGAGLRIEYMDQALLSEDKTRYGFSSVDVYRPAGWTAGASTDTSNDFTAKFPNLGNHFQLAPEDTYKHTTIPAPLTPAEYQGLSTHTGNASVDALIGNIKQLVSDDKTMLIHPTHGVPLNLTCVDGLAPLFGLSGKAVSVGQFERLITSGVQGHVPTLAELEGKYDSFWKLPASMQRDLEHITGIKVPPTQGQGVLPTPEVSHPVPPTRMAQPVPPPTTPSQREVLPLLQPPAPTQVPVQPHVQPLERECIPTRELLEQLHRGGVLPNMPILPPGEQGGIVCIPPSQFSQQQTNIFNRPPQESGQKLLPLPFGPEFPINSSKTTPGGGGGPGGGGPGGGGPGGGGPGGGGPGGGGPGGGPGGPFYPGPTGAPGPGGPFYPGPTGAPGPGGPFYPGPTGAPGPGSERVVTAPGAPGPGYPVPFPMPFPVPFPVERVVTVPGAPSGAGAFPIVPGAPGSRQLVAGGPGSQPIIPGVPGSMPIIPGGPRAMSLVPGGPGVPPIVPGSPGAVTLSELPGGPRSGFGIPPIIPGSPGGGFGGPVFPFNFGSLGIPPIIPGTPENMFGPFYGDYPDTSHAMVSAPGGMHAIPAHHAAHSKPGAMLFPGTTLDMQGHPIHPSVHHANHAHPQGVHKLHGGNGLDGAMAPSDGGGAATTSVIPAAPRKTGLRAQQKKLPKTAISMSPIDSIFGLGPQALPGGGAEDSPFFALLALILPAAFLMLNPAPLAMLSLVPPPVDPTALLHAGTVNAFHGVGVAHGTAVG